MCTIMTVSKEVWSEEIEKQILTDSYTNSDGFALLLFTEQGAHTILRSFSVEAVLELLNSLPWSRMFLHCRYATKGGVSLENIHGWANQGVFYMHNGAIAAPESALFAVDSQAIGEWLEGGVDTATKELQAEPYANVMLIDTRSNYYVVNRSKGGTLFTDGRGNFSTNRVWPMIRRVPKRSQRSFTMTIAPPKVIQTFDPYELSVLVDQDEDDCRLETRVPVMDADRFSHVYDESDKWWDNLEGQSFDEVQSAWERWRDNDALNIGA